MTSLLQQIITVRNIIIHFAITKILLILKFAFSIFEYFVYDVYLIRILLEKFPKQVDLFKRMVNWVLGNNFFYKKVVLEDTRVRKKV